MSAISAQGLSCGYGSRLVLSGVSFTLEAGSSTVLLGPNGGGKSTLLKTLAGLIPPLSGEVRVQERSLREIPALERARLIAVVPPEEKFEFPFTVREAVAMGRLPHANSFFDSSDDREATSLAMERAECDHLADRPVTEISAGEQQRVLLARALAQNAPILLLDEPTAHLDPAHQVGFVRLVKGLTSQGLTIVAAIHDLNLVPVMAEQAVLIGRGEALVFDSVENVLSGKLLEEVYGVEFERSKGSAGNLRLHPRF